MSDFIYARNSLLKLNIVGTVRTIYISIIRKGGAMCIQDRKLG